MLKENTVAPGRPMLTLLGQPIKHGCEKTFHLTDFKKTTESDAPFHTTA